MHISFSDRKLCGSQILVDHFPYPLNKSLFTILENQLFTRSLIYAIIIVLIQDLLGYARRT
jgi:hypothetical protein